ncbi:glycoside hydrolase family 99-like domain-containing protein [Cyanobium sp. CH-040]|uniref:glycoside hydrolase family 99-like domain-containing protein n=1 Tax=Cyanobium sp. CH-040 TaxID=2823708 RepID=UPI0020CB9D1E|nr:glycoside hydrolase family 99-like domain-containing protein [Cyanobium sp. CH-040]MCP9927199.1 glycoside hydrolase family 99-like domain-containing protein [Cyanobium sp. CH-040]
MPRLISLYLPQYHPIPENNSWWGEGFTEWRNVVQGAPRFPGHYQPHLPADLGFYDLRLPVVRRQQADLARQFGISGFCYYHYWFSGKQLLERPVAEILSSGEPDFPFCLCWANENWTRRWDGQDQDVLIAQEYSLSDDEAHLLALLPAFLDPRYIRVHNKPLFLVYRTSQLPDPRATTTLWRRLAQHHGLDGLYLVKVESFPSERLRCPEQDGFDAALDFQPDWGSLPPRLQAPTHWKLLNKIGLGPTHAFRSTCVFSYPHVVAAMLARPPVAYPRFPCVTPGWDNTARRRQGGGTVLHNSTPEAYGHWLRSVLADQRAIDQLPEPIVFINAWNEWAEGNHLEPDLRWGHAYLEATREALG